MENVPEEVRAYQEQFWAEEQAKKAIREAEKKLDPKRQARMEAILKKPNTARKIGSVAKKVYGCEIVGGNGRHGVHLVTKNNERIPLPSHGGGRTIASGTARSILSRVIAT